MRWTAFHYRLTAAPPRVRSALWRELHDLGAANLRQGLWAVPHGELDTVDLQPALDLVTGAGGEASTQIVGRGPRDLELQATLVRACEHVWDEFFNASDRLTVGLTRDLVVADHLVELDALRATFRDLLVRDLVMSEAAARAGVRLDEHVAAAPAPRGGDRLVRPVRRGVEIIGAHRLDDGTARYVVDVDPAFPLEEERSFLEFEAMAYTPDAGRVPLCHGCFVWVGVPAERDAAISAIEQRLRRYEQYRGW